MNAVFGSPTNGAFELLWSEKLLKTLIISFSCFCKTSLGKKKAQNLESKDLGSGSVSLLNNCVAQKSVCSVVVKTKVD